MAVGEAQRRLAAAVVLVAAAAGAIVLWAAWTAPWTPASALWYPLVITGLIAMCSLCRVLVPRRQQAVTATAAAIVLAVAVLPGPWVVLCTAVGVGAAKLARSRDAPKVLFNTGKDVVGAAGAVAGAWLAGLRPTLQSAEIAPLSWRAHLMALCLAALCYFVVDEVLPVPVVALATGRRWQLVARFNADIRAAVAVATFALGVGGVAAVVVDVRWLAAMPFAVAALYGIYSRRVHVREERQAWQRLADATAALTALDPDTVARDAARRAADLFTAGVDLHVTVPDRPPRLLRVTTAGTVVFDGAPGDAAPRREPGLVMPLDEQRGSLHLFPSGAGGGLSQRERYMLRTFVSAVSSALGTALAATKMADLARRHEYDATHDALTGLANRRQFERRLTEAVADPDRSRSSVLILIDLDGFKQVNDSLGHACGDRVLVEVARRLPRADQRMVVARLGGDEYALLMTGVATTALARHQAELVLADLRHPIDLDGRLIPVGASAGLATSGGCTTPAELLRRADVAMYEAKRTGGGLTVYRPSLDTADVTAITAAGQVTHALTAGQIRLTYHPIADLATGRVTAAHASPCWDHPDLGDLDSTRLMAAAARAGRLTEATTLVLRQAIADAADWAAAGLDVSTVVELPARQVLDAGFPTTVTGLLKQHRVDPSRLMLRISHLQDMTGRERQLPALVATGIKIAVDVVGLDHASLQLVHDAAIAALRLGPQYTRILHTPAGRAALHAVTGIGRELGLEVIADGVDTAEHRHILWQAGCTSGQGVALNPHPPLDSDQLVQALRTGHDGVPGVLVPALHDGATVIPLRSLPARR
ncbi:EAL domain-containing protein [Actinomycetes bacterium KLBMP 9797]